MTTFHFDKKFQNEIKGCTRRNTLYDQSSHKFQFLISNNFRTKIYLKNWDRNHKYQDINDQIILNSYFVHSNLLYSNLIK